MTNASDSLGVSGRLLFAMLFLVCASQSFAQGSYINRPTIGTGLSPSRIESADYDLDGDLDIIIANAGAANVQIFANMGNMAFAAGPPLLTGLNPTDVDFADVNNDGFPDVVVVCRTSQTLHVFLNNTMGLYNPPQILSAGTDPYSLTMHDLENDGDLDVIVVDHAASDFVIFVNDGSGTMTFGGTLFAGSIGPGELRMIDLDGDGDKDALCTFPSSNSLMISENVANSFIPFEFKPTGVYPLDLVVNDFDNDGNVDVAVANVFSDSISYFKGLGGFNFANGVVSASGSRPAHMKVIDSDNAFGKDIVVANVEGFLGIYHNDGTSNFTAFQSRQVGPNPYDIEVADFDGDFDDDIIAINIGDDTFTIVENQMSNVRFPGSGEDTDLVSIVDGNQLPNGQWVAEVTDGTIITNTMTSPGGTFDGSLGYLLAQAYYPGFPPFTVMPGFYINDSDIPSIILLSAPMAPATGISVSYAVPGGVAGFNFLVQGVALSVSANNGLAAFTDAVEFRILD